uniref:Amidase domain-containing protein n=2 Tax=Triticum urartu TaxID=4572 RepID=A0A8R7TQL2_TRIUA
MEDSGDDHGAIMEKFILLPPPSSDQQQQQLPLHGLTFAIKDIFDVAGRVTGFGTPDWARTHAPAAATAPAVLAALAAGATGVGKTVMDEMAYSINGENPHYGTPANPCAPGRVPGSSSSGSAVAVAVAVSLADFALGTDTGGSVRVPTAYCGIFGLRPSLFSFFTLCILP